MGYSRYFEEHSKIVSFYQPFSEHTVTLALVLSNSKQGHMLPDCEDMIAFPMTK